MLLLFNAIVVSNGYYYLLVVQIFHIFLKIKNKDVLAKIKQAYHIIIINEQECIQMFINRLFINQELIMLWLIH